MRRSLAFIVLASALAANLWAATSLGEAYEHRLKPIPIFIEEPVNRSEDSTLLPADLKKAFEEKFAARRNPRFTVVQDAKEAELVLSTEVMESIFSEHDPVDKLIGLGGTAWDAMHDDRYARVTGVFAIRETKSNRTVWTDKLKATITDAKMTRDESRPKVIARTAEILLREAFGKKRR